MVVKLRIGRGITKEPFNSEDVVEIISGRDLASI